MTQMKKQTKITKLFTKKAATPAPVPDDCEELQEELQQLELRLRELNDELFNLQRSSHLQRYKGQSSSNGLMDARNKSFTRPETIVLTNSVDNLKRNIEVLSLLSGMEVQSYEEDDHCTIVFHMQHGSQHELKHGLKIDITSGTNKVSSSSLPLGFNLDAVLEQFDNVMLPECLVAVRRALVAYYDRLWQFEKLKKALKLEAQLFKILDGSHMEVKFAAQCPLQPEEQVEVTLMLDYRVYDIRPKQCSFVEIDLPDEALEALKQQSAVFKRRPLHKAFKEAFLDGIGPYTMVQQIGVQHFERRRRQKRARPANPYNPNDDTFRPEDCSSEDDVEE